MNVGKKNWKGASLWVITLIFTFFLLFLCLLFTVFHLFPTDVLPYSASFRTVFVQRKLHLIVWSAFRWYKVIRKVFGREVGSLSGRARCGANL